MILEIEHRLKYTYSDYVGLNPHYFYLNPRPTPFQQIIESNLTILPKPDLLVKILIRREIFNNYATSISF
ncbi:MAG: hypothetical protein IPH28_03145 [Cytophagaceae bacterium]|nr:hypothetical protein [Cytophagaceae bacterium]